MLTPDQIKTRKAEELALRQRIKADRMLRNIKRRAVQAVHDAIRDARKKRHAHVLSLYKQGISKAEIARQMKIPYTTVCYIINFGGK